MRKLLLKVIDNIPISLKSCVMHIPGVNVLQRLVFKNQFGKGKFIHTLKNGPASGLTFPIHLPDDKNILVGNYELRFTKALLNYFSPGDVFYDIGGFKGYFSGILAMHGAKKVFVFEPMPDNINNIKELKQLNQKLPIQLIEAAVSDRRGLTTFYIMPDNSMGKLSESEFRIEEKGNPIQVRLITIDDVVFIEKEMPPNLIKIDVEGAETSVLRGATKCLDIFKPILLIEVHSRPLGRECYRFLTAKNYSIKVLETDKAPDFESEPEVCHYLCSCKIIKF